MSIDAIRRNKLYYCLYYACLFTNENTHTHPVTSYDVGWIVVLLQNVVLFAYRLQMYFLAVHLSSELHSISLANIEQ